MISEQQNGFKIRLIEYLSDTTARNTPIVVCETPDALIAVGARPLSVVINPNDVDKCLAERAANKNKNSHNLTVEQLSVLPELLDNPVLIFKEPKTGYITVVTDRFDKDGRPFVIGVELNSRQDWLKMVNRVTSMHGRERAFKSFIARNGSEVKGYIPRNIEEGNLIAANIDKATEFLRPTGLQLPEGRNFVTIN